MKKNGAFLSTIFLFLFPILLISQNEHEVCGATGLYLQMLEEEPSLAKKQEAIEEHYVEFVNKSAAQLQLKNETTLPVVVHVVHLPGTPVGTGENLEEADILAGLERLNNVFAGIPCGSDPPGNDMGIQFALAKRDINGHATSGILRHGSAYSELGFGGFTFMIVSISDFGAKFPTTDYLHIYLVKEICYFYINGQCSGPLGLATSASSHGNTADGMVVEARLWAGQGDPCMGAKLCAHEMGHIFNLQHTFENGCPNDNCLRQGDRVCDTPPDDRRDRTNSPCLNGGEVNSCSTDADDGYCNPFAEDKPDAEDNLMDYSPFDCQYRFTEGQKKRMHAALNGVRASFLETRGLEDACVNGINSNLQGRNTTTVDSMTVFHSNATNVDSFAWLVDGVFASDEVNLQYAFPDFGEHTVTLQMFNNGGCFIERSRVIKVYQTDCDFPVYLGDIPTLCSAWQGEYELYAVPSGGYWQDETGLFITGTMPTDYQPGTHKLFYTVTEGWCQKTVETDFTVADIGFFEVNFSEKLDCQNPEPFEMDIFTSESGMWTDSRGNTGTFGNFGNNVTTVEVAGYYNFAVYANFAECYFDVRAPFENPERVNIVTCDDCQNGVGLCLEGVPPDEGLPPNAIVNWKGGYPQNPGRWEVNVIDERGCVSYDRIDVASVDNKFPSCSAGSVSGIYCAGTATLLGAVSQGGETEYWWTTTDGNIVSGHRTLTPVVDRPGVYTFHARNIITGCSDSDDVNVKLLPKKTNVSETICFGESFDGYTESGTYIDTLAYACDCDSIRTLELTVLPESSTTIDTTICQGETFQGLSQSGTYQATYTDANGCDSIFVLNLTVSEAQIMFDMLPDDGTGVGSIDITDVMGGTPPYSYSWSNGETTSSIDSLDANYYSLTITDAIGCETVFDIQVEFISHLNSLNENIDVLLFPNPVSSGKDFILKMESPLAGFYKIKIVDNLGRLVKQKQHPHFSNTTQDIFSMPIAGFYFVLLENEKGERTVYKLVVD